MYVEVVGKNIRWKSIHKLFRSIVGIQNRSIRWFFLVTCSVRQTTKQRKPHNSYLQLKFIVHVFWLACVCVCVCASECDRVIQISCGSKTKPRILETKMFHGRERERDETCEWSKYVIMKRVLLYLFMVIRCICTIIRWIKPKWNKRIGRIMSFRHTFISLKMTFIVIVCSFLTEINKNQNKQLCWF